MSEPSFAHLASLGHELASAALCPRRPSEHAEWEREQASAARRVVADAEASAARELASLAKRTTPALARAVLTGTREDTDAVRLVLRWVDSGRRGLLLRGGVGAGKSFAAALAVHKLGEASWHRPNDFVSAVLHAYDDAAPKLSKRLVVIDDVGRETKTDFEEALCAFLDDSDARFILTANLTRDDFSKRYDLRLIDRLNDCAVAATAKGESRRKQTGGF